MISTLANIKTLLGYTDSTHDTLLTLLMPMVQDDILGYIKDNFKDTATYIIDDTFGFSASSISDSASGFVTAKMVTGNIIVEGSKYNDGFYTVTNVAAGTLTISETLITEVAETNREITITRVVYPKSLVLVFADMLKYRVDNVTTQHGIKSETLPDGYKIEFDTTLINYPRDIISNLDKFRKVAM